MKKIIFYLIVSSIFLSCSTNKKIEITDQELMTLNDFKIEKMKINDSIYKIIAEKNDFTFSGVQNQKGKIGWWKLYDNSDKLLIAKIQFLYDGKYDFPNQIIRYNKDKINFEKSKFYTMEPKNDSIVYKVFFPQEKNITSESTSFYYQLNSKPKDYKSAKVYKKENYYIFKIENKDIKNLMGIFSLDIDKGNYIMKNMKMKVMDTLKNASR